MRNVLFFFLLLFIFCDVQSQQVSGTWMSFNDPSIKHKTPTNFGDGGMVLSFERNTILDVETSSAKAISVNRKKSKIKAKGVKGKIMFKLLDNTTMELTGSKSENYMLKKLDLNYPTDWSEKDIVDFIINQQCQPLEGYDIVFMNYTLDVKGASGKTFTKNILVDKKTKEKGYWFIRKVEKNPFLVINFGENEPDNIFQIRSTSLNGLKLESFQRQGNITDFKLIKTCL